MKRSFTTFAAAAAFAVSALAFTPASAAETDTITMMHATISYADLDLNTEHDARTMLHRINRAARDVCRSDAGSSSIAARYNTRACMREAAMQTVMQLNHPMVSAMYEGRTPPAMMLAQR